MKYPSRFTFVAALLSVTTLSLGRTAFACTQDVIAPPLCVPTYVQLPATANLTPNVPAIPFRNATPAAFAEASPLVLRTAAGAEIATEVRADPFGGQLLVPLAPLAPTTEYTVHYVEHCTNGSETSPDAESVEHDVSFATTGSIALPTSMGEVTVRNTTMVTSLPTNAGCGGTVTARAAVAEIVLHPSNEFHAVLPVSTVFAGIGGPEQGSIGAVQYGTADASEIVVARLVAACEPMSGLSPTVRALGHYVVHVDARIAGSDAVIPTIEVPVDLACVSAGNDSDGGTDDGGTGSSSGGCNVRSTTSSTGAASFAELFALLGLATMRRMRRRR